MNKANRKPNSKSVINVRDFIRLSQEYMFADVTRPDIRDFVRFILEGKIVYTINIGDKVMNDEVKTPAEEKVDTPAEETTGTPEEKTEEAPAEEKSEETPADEAPAEEASKKEE